MSSRVAEVPQVERRTARGQTTEPGASLAAAALLALLSVWIVAGSTGMLAHSLRRGLALALVTGVVMLAWPLRPRRAAALVWLGLSLAAAALLFSSPLAPLNVLAVAIVLLALSRGQESRNRLLIQQIAEAAVLLVIYRIACTSVPWLWLIADQAGGFLGRLAATITRQPLKIGATFGGLDFLVVMSYLVMASLIRWPSGSRDRDRRPDWRTIVRPALFYLGAMLLCQLLYLAILSFAPSILKAEFPPPRWLSPLRMMILWNKLLLAIGQMIVALHVMIPWNMPLLAALFQSGLFFVILLRIRRVPAAPAADISLGWNPLAIARPAIVLAIAVAAVIVVARFPMEHDLQNKKIVFYEKGYLNWLKPEFGQYGRLASGMYGLTPAFLESYGARPLVSSDLSEADLKGADAVVTIFPNEPWRDGQLQRLWKFVEDGGTLLVAGEHTVWENGPDGRPADISDGSERARFNDALKPTSIYVNFDTAEFAIGGWLHSYEALAHPITAGIRDEQNEFGVVIGASLNVRFPARPVLVGRYGWASPGDPTHEDRAMMGAESYEAGNKLGDIVLVAEQSLGKGKVVVFGDPSGFVNGIMPGCHDFMSRMYCYLSQGGGVALPPWRLWLALGLLVALAVALLLIRRPEAYAAAVLGLSVAMSVCTSSTYRGWELLPDGRTAPDGSPRVPNNLAYIDTSHFGAFSPEDWRPEGLMGLKLNLMRNGYLALNLGEMTSPRLERARLLVSVAPAKPFTRREIDMVETFVRNGGVFISTVGYDDVGPSREMLANLGFYIGQRPEDERLGREPTPLSFFKAPFFNGETYMAYVRFFAGWRVICDDPARLVISQDPAGDELIVMRRLGKGLIVVVGDTFFAANKNLENEGGEPIDDMHENAVFWHWLLTLLQNGMGEGQTWIPQPSDCTPNEQSPQPGQGSKLPPSLRSPDDPPDDDNVPVKAAPSAPAESKPADKPVESMPSVPKTPAP